MIFKQFYLGCLAHASYYIGSEGEAAVVDPQRDVQQYLDEAETSGQRIKYIIETHLHADFVGGHSELAARTGAQIVFGARANAPFQHLAARDGDRLKIGAVELQILETPGHTPEGISIVVTDLSDASQQPKVLTGDTLFIGDVGRPDLAGSKDLTAEQMAGFLYDSLNEKILKLPDETEVYPAHGAGSLCGKNISKETWSTIGEQRKANYALQPMSKENFVRMMTENLPEAPGYFPKSVAKNLAGAADLKDLPQPEALSASEVRDFQGIILDVRSADEFGAAHIPGSLNIGLGGQFAPWAGTLIDDRAPLVIVAGDEKQIAETRTRLARVGIETIRGFLKNGIAAWQAAGFETKSIEQVSAADAKNRIGRTTGAQFIDVRRSAEYESGHAPGAVNLTLSDLKNLTEKLDPARPTFVICQGGYRSSMATSILEQKGFREIYNIAGGTAAWAAANDDGGGGALEIEMGANARQSA